MRESIVNRIYDAQVDGFSADGAWDPVAIEVIRKSLKDLGILDSLPDAQHDLQRQVRAGEVLT